MRVLRDRSIVPGERWIFSAGFNVDASMRHTGRIDVELDDLRFLRDAGARVAVISHQGSWADGTAAPLDYVAAYLGERLGAPVAYRAWASGPDAERAAAALAPGEVALFGNTRLQDGEERNDPAFAAALARLGDRVAVGGFAKAHRVHASNVGILGHRPGYAAASLLSQAAALAAWAGPGTGDSVAVLGGVKPEKTCIGFTALHERYDLIIPGGSLLNTILAIQGYRVGASRVGDDACHQVVEATLRTSARAGIALPSRVVVASPTGATAVVEVADGVPDGCAIVDFLIEPPVLNRLRTAARVLVAGTPGDARFGNRHAAAAVVTARAGDRDTLLLGGDTVIDLPWNGPYSTGGGAALAYLATGTCAVLDALARNAAEGPRDVNS